jgi:hypothetical protein
MENESDNLTDNHNWSSDIEKQLNNIEINASRYADISKSNYLDLMNQIKYFKIPVIFFSGINSVFAIGLNSFVDQSAVSIVTCIISFFVSLLSSIELYLGITKKIETALTSYRDFYLLSIKINNCLRLDRNHRSELDGRAFLTKCLTEYEQLFNNSNITPDKFEDQLTTTKLEISNPI